MELFCQHWVDSIGNATYAALKSFDIEGKEIVDQEPPQDKDAYTEFRKKINKIESTASSIGSEYLRKPEIIKRIDEILETRGFNDDAVKREHYRLIRGADDSVRMRAISEYYKLKGRYEPEKKEVTLRDLRNMTDEQLTQLLD